MEKRYQHTVNGQSVIEADLNVLGETSALADDRVFAELFRMTPDDTPLTPGLSGVARGILPFDFSRRESQSLGDGVVCPAGATGSVKVFPFRALIGSRTVVGTDALKNWRDIRSTVSVGTTTQEQTVAIAANASGSPRWDLVYAAVAVDASASSVTRKMKDPTTKVISSTSVVTTLQTTVSLAVVAGTPSGSPAWPAVPSDASGTYYIPLAYVRVPNGFGASSTVLKTDLAEVAPTIRLSTTTGGGSLEPANQHTAGTKGTGDATTIVSASNIHTWGSSGTRSGRFIPSTVTGKRELIIAVDSSITHGTVVDDRDWRGRVSRFGCQITAGSYATEPWAVSTWGSVTAPSGQLPPVWTTGKPTTQFGFGNSINPQTSSNDYSIVAMVYADQFYNVTSTDMVLMIVCDHLDGGKLKFLTTTHISASFAENTDWYSESKVAFFWIDFTGPFANAST